MGVKVCKSVNNFLLPPPPPDMKGELRKPTVIGGLKIKSRNLLTFLACNPLQKLNPPFAQNLTSEVSLTKSYGFGLCSLQDSPSSTVGRPSNASSTHPNCPPPLSHYSRPSPVPLVALTLA